MENILQHTSKWFVTAQHILQKTLQSLQNILAPLLAWAGGIEQICVMTARGLLGLFFIYFGLDKFVNYADTTIYMSSFSVPGLFLPVVILLEIAGGIALLVGWRFKLTAGLLAGFTGLAALVFHSDFAEPVQVILFMKNMAIVAGLLLFVAIGAGQLSLDAQKAKKTRKPKKSK